MRPAGASWETLHVDQRPRPHAPRGQRNEADSGTSRGFLCSQLDDRCDALEIRRAAASLTSEPNDASKAPAGAA